jgi:hypothetical protein
VVDCAQSDDDQRGALYSGAFQAKAGFSGWRPIEGWELKIAARLRETIKWRK